GIITIDLAETDDPTREQVRQDMGEAYRTMLGHLRHETGHYYWYLLVEQPDLLDSFRELFGDERADYQESINRHYSQGAPDGWEQDYVSAYATMHPWEDFAETFAHYLHIRDTLQTAAAYGVRIDVPAGEDLVADPDVEVEHEPFDAILSDWLPLTYALNALNRSMGNGDLYPFVLSPGVIRKLTWVHHRVTPKEIAHNKELASSAAAKGAAASNGAGGPHGGSHHTGRRSLLARLKASRR
ncbi:MAG TPA: putative zinc-binding metallopeptidase, partial [Pseudonocardia sp.]